MKAKIAILIASTLFASSVFAQAPASTPAATGPSTASMAKSDSQRNSDVEKHIVDLHTKLKITTAEEPQWNAVAQTMRDNATGLDKAIDKREANATAVDDLNSYGEVVQAHADGIKKLASVFSSLYSSMSADQKKVADEVFVHRAPNGKPVPVAQN